MHRFMICLSVVAGILPAGDIHAAQAKPQKSEKLQANVSYADDGHIPFNDDDFLNHIPLDSLKIAAKLAVARERLAQREPEAPIATALVNTAFSTTFGQEILDTYLSSARENQRRYLMHYNTSITKQASGMDQHTIAKLENARDIKRLDTISNGIVKTTLQGLTADSSFKAFVSSWLKQHDLQTKVIIKTVTATASSSSQKDPAVAQTVNPTAPKAIQSALRFLHPSAFQLTLALTHYDSQRDTTTPTLLPVSAPKTDAVSPSSSSAKVEFTQSDVKGKDGSSAKTDPAITKLGGTPKKNDTQSALELQKDSHAATLLSAQTHISSSQAMAVASQSAHLNHEAAFCFKEIDLFTAGIGALTTHPAHAKDHDVVTPAHTPNLSFAPKHRSYSVPYKTSSPRLPRSRSHSADFHPKK